MEGLKIVLAGVVGAILYGILHDQVTAQVCVEYFTIVHPDLFGITNPTLLAFGWGIVATWWAGLAVGVFAALVARVGSRSQLALRDLWRPILLLLLGMGVAALLAGLIGYHSGVGARALFPSSWISQIEPDRHTRFFAVAAAHDASYTAGFSGGLALCAWVGLRRRRLARQLLIQA